MSLYRDFVCAILNWKVFKKKTIQTLLNEYKLLKQRSTLFKNHGQSFKIYRHFFLQTAVVKLLVN